MQTNTIQTAPTALKLWTSRVVRTILVALLLVDCTVKLIAIDPVIESLMHLGYPVQLSFAIGAIELFCTILYAIPRTAVLGAVLLTGQMGGAIASHLRAGDPLLSHTLFGVYIGVLLWGGLWLRDDRLRALIPLRREAA